MAPAHATPGDEPPHGRGRWGVLSPVEPRSPAPPEPIDWKPPPTLRERVLRGVTTPALLGGLVFVIAVVIAIVMVVLRPHEPVELSAEGTDSAATASADAAAAESVDGAGDPAATDTVAPAAVFVHVVGEVNTPGVVELTAGARVDAAIAAAGGATDAAVLAGVNLAREVVDGEQIHVPDTESPGAAPLGGGAGGPAGGEAATGVINLNTADVALLESLPRVGPALAQRIIDWREMNGPFTSIDQLLQVSGIGAKTLEGFRDRVGV